ncbi:TPA: hypothetical protein DCQ44_01310 [Candidatus Taylorbacteria bacterium]|nr:hypothetical protein [Candidatus Taylorbacteria bacterium]
MHRLFIKIRDRFANILFPQNNLEKEADVSITDAAKIQKNDGDQSIKYPSPAYSFFAYRTEAVRSMIWRLKYRCDMSVAAIFGKNIHDHLCEELAELSVWSNFRDPLLIPIPISKKKLRLRGFNQSAALCKALATIDENRFFVYAPNVLNKVKDTKSQARVKDKRSRLENLKDSFAVKDNSSINNRNIILLDDVLTTGSTLTEATNTLKKSGAGNIIWLTIAH